MGAVGKILAVPGLESTTPHFRYALWSMAQRNGWDVDAIAAVMSMESGFRPDAKNPKATASGLIQMIDATAKSVGVPGGADGLRKLSAVEQLPYVETFYGRAFGRSLTPRAVDYYLAGWGSGVGAPMSHVLARRDDPLKFNGGTENLYTLNSALDRNKDGTISVSDIDAHMKARQAKAGGAFVDVFSEDSEAIPLVVEPGSGVSPGLPSAGLASRLSRLCGALPVLERGAVSDVVPLLAFLLGVNWEGRLYAAELVHHVRVFQSRRRLKVDGVIGPITWGVLLGEVRPWQ